jgi:hypothetical protein
VVGTDFLSPCVAEMLQMINYRLDSFEQGKGYLDLATCRPSTLASTVAAVRICGRMRFIVLGVRPSSETSYPVSRRAQFSTITETASQSCKHTGKAPLHLHMNSSP